jgi:predicted glycoside hydrolase/deacetylase ChbG (UPF0249 family)
MGRGGGTPDGNEPAQLPDNSLHDSFSGKSIVNVKLETKRIAICADDFGMNGAIDEGILSLAQRGRLTATSCLVTGPSFLGNVPALRQSGLQLGLHLNFTEALGQPGLYLPINKLIVQTYLLRLDTGRVREQIVAQLDAFEDALGQSPDFVDGHQHVHQFPQIRDELLFELARRYPSSKPWLRYTKARRAPSLPARMRFKARVIQALGSRRFAQLAQRQGFPLNSRFLGVYDFQGGQEMYAVLLRAWLSHAADGDLLMCHPAKRVDSLDALGAQRQAEFEVLAGDQAGQWLDDYGLKPGRLPIG